MTSNQKDALWQFLFASDDCSLVNLKLMRGDSQDVSVEDVRNQVHSALLQVKDGTVEGLQSFPEVHKGGQVNITELAEKL